MNRLKVGRLALRNFKGATAVELEPGGRNLVVRGDNATGKTTLHDAWTWLLFDKDSSGAAVFQIKTVGPDGQPKSGLEHEVEADLVNGDGGLTLRKVYAEKWVKRRGSSDAELTGHETKHYLNGVPATKRAYDDAVAAIAPAEWFRTLSDPLFFNGALDWKARRRILVDAYGGVTEDELEDRHPDLKPLTRARGKHSVADFRKILDERRKALAKERATLPARIDELDRSLEGAPIAANAEVAAIAADQAVDKARAALEAVERDGGAAAAKAERVALADERTRLLDAARHAHQVAVDDAHQAMRRASAAADDAAEQVARLERAAAERETELEEARAHREEMLERFHAVRAETFPEPADPGACPGCGRPMPAERIAEARAAAEAAWREEQARRLQTIQGTGKQRAALIARLEQARSDHALADTRARDGLAEALDASVSTRAAYAAANGAPIVEPERVAAIDALLEQPLPETRDTSAEREHLAASIAAAKAAHAQVAEAAAAGKARARIEALQEDDRRLAGEVADTDALLDLCDRHTRYKVGALEEAINQHFKRVRYRLFEDQINGGVAEICTATVDGVPWDSLNHGARINAGLDVIDALAEHRGFAPPVWIDNAESITAINPTVGQQIRLVVSRDHQTLTPETETTE